MSELRVTCHAADVLPIDALVEFQGKLKTITRENLDKLKRSILRHGFSAPIFVWRGVDNHILDGHQRLKALEEFRKEGYDVPLLPVVYIDADSEAHAKEKLLYITSQYGEFTREGFAEFTDGLDFTVEDIRFTDGEFSFSPETDAKIDDTYSREIKAPTYEPKGEKPPIDDIVDDTKVAELLADIQSADITDEEKAFLTKAAYRHRVFHYRKIADLYAHSGVAMQDLMERSALVIIDFDKAIEYGFVKLTEEIAEQYTKDYDDT